MKLVRHTRILNEMAGRDSLQIWEVAQVEIRLYHSNLINHSRMLPNSLVLNRQDFRESSVHE